MNITQLSRQLQKDFFSFIYQKGLLKNLFFHSAFALSFTAGLSYTFGFLRDRLLAQTFGASAHLDTYYASFVIPDILLAIFVTSCISTALIPLYSAQLHKSTHVARTYFYTLLIIISVLIIVLAGIIAIIIPYLTPLLIPGFSEEQRALYITTVRIMLLSPIIFSFSNFFGGVLLSVRDYFFYGIAPVFYNLGIIIGIFIFVPSHGIIGLAWGTVLGAFLHLFSRIGIAISRLGHGPVRFTLTPEIKKSFLLMIPKIFQLGAWQGLLAWFIFLASQMETGSVTVYSFARNFQSMPVSLIGIALSLSAYTTLSHYSAQKNFTAFTRHIIKKSLMIILITSLSALVLALMSVPLIQTVLGGKAFDINAITLTAVILSFYTISIPLESLMHLLARAHYALQHTFRPSLIHIIAIGITISIGYLWKDMYGLKIIPISFAIGLLVQNILLIISLHKLLPQYATKKHTT